MFNIIICCAVLFTVFLLVSTYLALKVNKANENVAYLARVLGYSVRLEDDELFIKEAPDRLKDLKDLNIKTKLITSMAIGHDTVIKLLLKHLKLEVFSGKEIRKIK